MTIIHAAYGTLSLSAHTCSRCDVTYWPISMQKLINRNTFASLFLISASEQDKYNTCIAVYPCRLELLIDGIK